MTGSETTDARQPSAFAGTALYYARYRPPYPDDFLCQLRSRAGTSGNGLLLDLACGPGRLAIPLAAHFHRVVAVDVEAEMIGVARVEARRRSASNIVWQVGRAEDLQLAPGSAELITIGEAFHRLDQARVLTLARDWLQPGGALVTLGAEPIWRGEEPWKRILVETVKASTGNALGDPEAAPWGGPADRLHAAGLQVEEHETRVDCTWTCDSIIGFMFSTSFASHQILGERAAAFEANLRDALLELNPDGHFPCLQRFSFTLGRKVSAGG